jgi:DNA-directed RNA polymerase subunit RPC12/RpoP
MKKMNFDPNEWHKIQNEPFKTFNPKDTVKLPCGHGSVEAKQGQDQYLECPDCKSKFLLSWQHYSTPKIRGKE